MWVPEKYAGTHSYVRSDAVHVEAFEAVRRMTSESGYVKLASGPLAHPRLGLDIGGADVNGSARSLIPFMDRWIGVDIVPGPGVDVVADATSITSLVSALGPAPQFDVVLCTEVLEHVAGWREIVANAIRFLVPGGVAFFTAASTDGKTWARRPHGARGELDPPAGEYYGNVHFEALAHQFTWCHVASENRLTYDIETNPSPGDVYAWVRKD
jgi:hypothetical protein